MFTTLKAQRVGGGHEEYAATTNDLKECACCGKKIRKFFVVAKTNEVVGTECATSLELCRPEMLESARKFYQISPVQYNFYQHIK